MNRSLNSRKKTWLETVLPERLSVNSDIKIRRVNDLLYINILQGNETTKNWRTDDKLIYYREWKEVLKMHTYINAVLSAIYMYDMYVYIYRYIYKVASKNGFLICNACSHSHSPTLHLFRRYSLCIYSFLFTLSFLSFFLYETRIRR